MAPSKNRLHSYTPLLFQELACLTYKCLQLGSKELFPIEDVKLETLSSSINPKFISIIEKSRKSKKEEGRIFLEDIQLPLT